MGKETKESKCLGIIISKFKVYDVDFMNFAISKEQPLTYHHIIPKRKNGPTVVENGAALTKNAHVYFHIIERKNYIIAKKLNRLFLSLHEQNLLLDEEYFEQVDYLLEEYERRKIRVYIK